MDNSDLRGSNTPKSPSLLAPFAVVVLLALTLILVFLVLDRPLSSPCGFMCPGTSSVSNAPSP